MAKTQRNSPCPCGSGKKYKKCCGFIQQPITPCDHSLAEEHRSRKWKPEEKEDGESKGN